MKPVASYFPLAFAMMLLLQSGIAGQQATKPQDALSPMEALTEAKKSNKPIFGVAGLSSCLNSKEFKKNLDSKELKPLKDKFVLMYVSLDQNKASEQDRKYFYQTLKGPVDFGKCTTPYVFVLTSTGTKLFDELYSGKTVPDVAAVEALLKRAEEASKKASK